MIPGKFKVIGILIGAGVLIYALITIYQFLSGYQNRLIQQVEANYQLQLNSKVEEIQRDLDVKLLEYKLEQERRIGILNTNLQQPPFRD